MTCDHTLIRVIILGVFAGGMSRGLLGRKSPLHIRQNRRAALKVKLNSVVSFCFLVLCYLYHIATLRFVRLVLSSFSNVEMNLPGYVQICFDLLCSYVQI